MTHAIYYPPADRSQWYGNGNATVSPTKLLWHSTETPGGWPDYASGTMAPNLTYDPWRHLWRQHFPLNGTARALRNGPGYSTNRVGVCQVEVSCYCDPARFGSGRGVDRIDAQAYDDMGRFAEFMRAEWGIPFSTLPQKPYPSSYGNNGIRLSPAAFQGYSGHCAHMHAPFNDHGDCGAMNVVRIVQQGGGDDMPSAEEVAAAVWAQPVKNRQGESWREDGFLLNASEAAADTINYKVPVDGGTADLWSLIVDTRARVIALQERLDKEAGA